MSAAEEKFGQAIAAYNSRDYAKAKTELLAVLALQPNSPPTIYNLALTEHALGEKGAALGHLRRALDLQPGLPNARRALALYGSKIDYPFGAHESSNWQLLRDFGLRSTSIDTALSLTALLLLVSGWLAIRYFARRLRALREESELPAAPVVGLIVAPLCLLMILFTAAKFWDDGTAHGTILADRTALRSSPSPDGTPLLELNQGVEVEIKNLADDWVQVSFSNSATGWVQKAQVLPSSGPQLWQPRNG